MKKTNIITKTMAICFVVTSIVSVGSLSTSAATDCAANNKSLSQVYEKYTSKVNQPAPNKFFFEHITEGTKKLVTATININFENKSGTQKDLEIVSTRIATIGTSRKETANKLIENIKVSITKECGSEERKTLNSQRKELWTKMSDVDQEYFGKKDTVTGEFDRKTGAEAIFIRAKKQYIDDVKKEFTKFAESIKF